MDPVTVVSAFLLSFTDSAADIEWMLQSVMTHDMVGRKLCDGM